MAESQKEIKPLTDEELWGVPEGQIDRADAMTQEEIDEALRKDNQ